MDVVVRQRRRFCLFERRFGVGLCVGIGLFIVVKLGRQLVILKCVRL